MGTQGATNPNESDAERYARLFGLYRELESELTALEHEGLVLREEVQKAIDKEEMKKVLFKIVQSS